MTDCPRCAGHEHAFRAAEVNLRHESDLHEKALIRIRELEAEIAGMKTSLGAIAVLLRAGGLVINVPNDAKRQ